MGQDAVDHFCVRDVFQHFSPDTTVPALQHIKVQPSPSSPRPTAASSSSPLASAPLCLAHLELLRPDASHPTPPPHPPPSAPHNRACSTYRQSRSNRVFCPAGSLIPRATRLTNWFWFDGSQRRLGRLRSLRTRFLGGTVRTDSDSGKASERNLPSSS